MLAARSRNTVFDSVSSMACDGVVSYCGCLSFWDPAPRLVSPASKPVCENDSFAKRLIPADVHGRRAVESAPVRRALAGRSTRAWPRASLVCRRARIRRLPTDRRGASASFSETGPPLSRQSRQPPYGSEGACCPKGESAQVLMCCGDGRAGRVERGGGLRHAFVSTKAWADPRHRTSSVRCSCQVPPVVWTGTHKLSSDHYLRDRQRASCLATFKARTANTNEVGPRLGALVSCWPSDSGRALSLQLPRCVHAPVLVNESRHRNPNLDAGPRGLLSAQAVRLGDKRRRAGRGAVQRRPRLRKRLSSAINVLRDPLRFISQPRAKEGAHERHTMPAGRAILLLTVQHDLVVRKFVT